MNKLLLESGMNSFSQYEPHDPIVVIENIQSLVLKLGGKLKLPSLFRQCQCSETCLKANVVISSSIDTK